MKPSVSITGRGSEPTGDPGDGSRIAAELTLDGALSGGGALTVLGAVRGSIDVARLVVRELSRVEGSVRAGEVEVRGEVDGEIRGGVVSLFKGGKVRGEITSEHLFVQAGADFEGRAVVAPFTPVGVAAE